MPERLFARINPVALVWAREVRGMPPEVAAAKISVALARLQSFESGEEYPTVIQLRKIGRIYRKPTAFFYITRLPQKPARLEDFRSFPDVFVEESPELVDAVTRSREQRLDAIELSFLLGRSIPDFGVSATLETPPERLAFEIRQRLAVDITTQETWREPYKALRSWIDAAERVGVLIKQFSGVSVSEARGFSIAERPYPIIAINGSDWPRAKIFTLFHELAHIALSASGICDLNEETHSVSSIEPMCNRVAGEALVPAEVLLADPIVSRHGSLRWEDSMLQALSLRFAVSGEVVLRRLLTLGRTTPDFYREKRRAYIQAAEREEEGKRGFVSYFRRILRDNGRAFASLALDAYRSEAISSLEYSRLLGGINFKHFGPIEEALSARQR